MKKNLVISLLFLCSLSLIALGLQNLGNGNSNLAAALGSVNVYPCVVIAKDLSQGLRDTRPNSEIIKLQQFLISKGYSYLEATGFFGLNTRKAVIAWQYNNGISASGFVGPLTRAAIKKATCGSVETKVTGPAQSSVSAPLQTISVSSPGAGAVLKELDVLKTSWVAVSGDFSHYQVNLKNRLSNIAVSLASTRAVTTEITISRSLLISFFIGSPGVKESAVRSNFYVEVIAEKPASVGQRSYIAIGKTGAFSILDPNSSNEIVNVTNEKIREKLTNVVFDRRAVTVLQSNFIAELDVTLDGKIGSDDLALISNFPRVEVSKYEFIKAKLPVAVSNRLHTKVGDTQYVSEFDFNNDGAILDDDVTTIQDFLNQAQVNP